MAADKPVASADAVNEADLASAFQELAKGERAATALENQLSAMESRINELLEQAEREQEGLQKRKEVEPKVEASGEGSAEADASK